MHNEIYRIAYQLNSAGKTPSVALIKAKLSKPTALPIIIQALQRWKASPQLGKDVLHHDAQTQAEQSTIPEVQGTSNIEQRLDILEQKVDKILAILAQNHS